MQGVFPDFEDIDTGRIGFSASHNLMQNEITDAPLNLLIEIRNSEGNLNCWTVMSLYNPAQELNIGRWRLPVYKTPTKLDIDVMQVPALKH